MTIGRGNCRTAGERLEKQKACFSTVPTALGKLGEKRPEFPTVPTASTAGYKQKKKNDATTAAYFDSLRGHFYSVKTEDISK